MDQNEELIQRIAPVIVVQYMIGNPWDKRSSVYNPVMMRLLEPQVPFPSDKINVLVGKDLVNKEHRQIFFGKEVPVKSLLLHVANLSCSGTKGQRTNKLMFVDFEDISRQLAVASKKDVTISIDLRGIQEANRKRFLVENGLTEEALCEIHESRYETRSGIGPSWEIHHYGSPSNPAVG